MTPMPSPSTLKGKRYARLSAAADKENQEPLHYASPSRSGDDSGFRPAGKFSSNSSLSIAIHAPSKSNSQQFRTATCHVELPPTPITAGQDSFPGANGKSPSPALLNIELPMTPTSAGFPSSPASSSSQTVDLPSAAALPSHVSAEEFEERLRQLSKAPGAPKIGACDSGIFSDFPSSSSSTSLLSDILPEFPPALSDTDESMFDILHDDVDEDDDEHEAQTPMKHFGGVGMGLGMTRSGGIAMQREATVQLISTPAQLEMQTALQRRRDGGSGNEGIMLPSLFDIKGKAPARFNDLPEDNATGLILTSHFDKLGLHDRIVPLASDNGLGLTLGPISNPLSLPLPTEVASIVLEAKEGLPLVKGLRGLGISLQGEPTKDELAQPTLAPPGQIRPASQLPKQKASENSPAPWQQQEENHETTPSQSQVRVPLSDSRRSSNATASATPLSLVAVNRPRLGGLTPTNSPTTKVGTPTSPAKRSATAATLSSHLQFIANGKENQDPLQSSFSSSGSGSSGVLRSNKSSSSSSNMNSSLSGTPTSPDWMAAAASSSSTSRKRSRIALR
ncbi:hypothetical protein OC835_006750 [Tilletia horrida]|nr:hypothetical protein OC835_006750 [Tilletia horrida]